ncbi:sigma-70 family RNA polymerase sigma factor [Candidatus Pacearchaeota archaeon]|nr:sigma-70 family RNA polymerase sigma factor [Candidatus Pacearchaeota archaeon]
MNLEQINDTYGKVIWSISGRYHMGIWDQMDVYNEVLLQVYSAIKKGQISLDDPDTARSIITGFAICRGIDLIRKEYKRQGIGSVYRDRRSIGGGSYTKEELDELEVESSVSEFEYELEKRLVWETLVTHLPLKSAIFVYELSFPSSETIQIAVKEQEKAKKDSKLRMNVNHLRILPRHVAESLSPEFQFSKATISRIKKHARETLSGVLGLELDIKTVHVTRG